MTRKQIQIPGTERTEIPAVEQAAEKYRELRDERAEMSKREAQAKRDLIAVMRAEKIPLYRYHDHDGEELEVRLDDDPKLTVKKTGEADSPIGEGVSLEPVSPRMDGLVAEALRSQAAAGVEVDDVGDVGVPETAAPKAKRGRPKKAKPAEVGA